MSRLFIICGVIIITLQWHRTKFCTGDMKSQGCHVCWVTFTLLLDACSLSLIRGIDHFGGQTNEDHHLEDSAEVQSSHLDFRYNGPSFRAGTSKCSERSWGHHGAGPGETAEVTARDIILLMPHDDGIHDKEASPWQPKSVLLGDEWSTLKVQGYGYAPIGHQVKTGRDIYNVRMNVGTLTAKINYIFFKYCQNPH